MSPVERKISRLRKREQRTTEIVVEEGGKEGASWAWKLSKCVPSSTSTVHFDLISTLRRTVKSQINPAAAITNHSSIKLRLQLARKQLILDNSQDFPELRWPSEPYNDASAGVVDGWGAT